VRFHQGDISRNLRSQGLADPQTDASDIAILNRAENNLARGLRPTRKEHLPHQASDLLIPEAIRVPWPRLSRRRRLGLRHFRFEDVACQRVFQQIWPCAHRLFPSRT
jgi:hypothetical protein